MIDIENDVLDAVKTAVLAAFPGTDVSGEYTESPALLPAVTVTESDNRVKTSMRTVKIENAVTVMYEANVYSNKSAGRKQQAKAIANVMDETFANLGFTRTFRNPVPNLKDATIYRILCRYQADVGAGKTEGTFLVYQS